MNYKKNKLKGTKYMYSKKPLKFKSIPKGYELTQEEIINLKDTIEKLDLQVIDKLVKQCLLKICNNNYKAGSVERVWIEKKNSFEGRSLGIPTLRDRVLQKIIWLAIHPIAEYQADPNSYAFREKRCALNALAKVCKSCLRSQFINTRKLVPIESCKNKYLNIDSRLKYRARYKVKSRPGKKLSKTQLKCKYRYYIFCDIRKRKKISNTKKSFNLAKYIRI